MCSFNHNNQKRTNRYIDDSTDFMNALARVQDGGMFHIYLKISQDDLNTTSSPNKKRRLNNNNPQNVFNESSNVSVYHKPSSNPPTKTPTKTPTTPTHPYSYYHSPYPYYEPYTSPPQTHAHLPPHGHPHLPPTNPYYRSFILSNTIPTSTCTFT
eukprot:70670_1